MQLVQKEILVLLALLMVLLDLQDRLDHKDPQDQQGVRPVPLDLKEKLVPEEK